MTEEHHIQVDLGGGRGANVPVDLPGNQINKRKERPRQEKIITGTVVQRQPSLWHRAIGSIFVPENEGESVWEFVVLEVLIPAAKNMFLDALNQGAERALYGAFRIRSRADRPSGYVSYNRVSGTRRAAPDFTTISKRGRAQHDFREVIFPTRGDAMDVLDKLKDLADSYGQATVEDFYDLVGITGQFTDTEWGWTDLSEAEIRHVRGGYMIILPRTKPIE